MVWLSKAAVLWVLDDAAAVPPQLVSTLLAVARYAGEDGRGAHPSATTVARHTRKTERQAKRDLGELVRLGLLLRGDQELVKEVRADRRPTVYDLAMPRGVTDVTPPANGVTHRVGRGDTQGQHGVSPMSPEEILKTSRTSRPPGGPSQPLSANNGLTSESPASWVKNPRSEACKSAAHKQCAFAPGPDGPTRDKWCHCPCHPAEYRRAGSRAVQRSARATA
jgi:helix-turn-helix protein